MDEDVVEIIEIYPEIIEISDETDEESKDFIEITYDSEDLENGNNENEDIAIKEETSESTDLGGNTTDVENLIEICEVAGAETTNNTTNTCRTKTRNIKIGNSRRKRRNKFRSRSVNTANGANLVLNTANSPKGIYDKVARSSGASCPENTENPSQIIKQENETNAETSRTDEETVQNIANSSGDEMLQNTLDSNNSHANKPKTSSSRKVPRQKHSDYSKLNWLKPLNSLSSPPHLQLVIIDRSHPDWKIETEKWLMIEKRLLERLHCEMLRSNDRSIGLFDGAKWQRGIKIVGCHNKKALNFVKNFILNLDKLWTGAKLDVFPMSCFVRQICKVFIPPPILKTDVVLSLIKLQNPSVCTQDWEVLGERERNHGIDIWLSVSEQSYQDLRRSRGEIKYGINRIFLNPVL